MSTPHYHTQDSKCLQPVPAVPANLEGAFEPDGSLSLNDDGSPRSPMVEGTGWYRCKERAAYYVHDHHGHFDSHFPRDTKACPA